MLRYLECYEVKQSETDLDDIIDGTIAPGPKWASEQLAVYSRQNKLLAKIISTSLSCTLSRQVMDIKSGSEMWSYLSKRFEGRENATTTLFTQRTLRQKLDLASCRPGADVENHLNYMMSLREQLTALKADVGDAWMVDLMVRSMSQYRYYTHLQTLHLIGSDKLNSPVAAKSIILTLDKNALVEKQLQARRFGGNQAGGGACNRSLVGDKRYFLTYRTLVESEKEPIYSIHGITMPEGVGTIEIWWNVQGKIVSVQAHTAGYVLDAKYNEGVVYKERHEQEDEVVVWSYEAESDAVGGVDGAGYNICDDASESFEAAAEERRLEGPVESVFYDADAKIPADELVINEIRKYDADAVADDEDAVEEPEPEDEPEPDENGEVESIAETADEAEADAADVSALEDTATPKTEGGSVDEEADSENEDQETYDSAAELTTWKLTESPSLMELYKLECAVNVKKQVARTQQKGCTQGSAELDCVSMTATENRSSRSLSVETERVWHESEVRPPRAYKAVMNSLQHKEGWKGMEEEMAATEAKDVLELVSETEMPKGRKVLNTT
eukprot:jgi/Phyca11/21031/fgenesh1_pg.PHYCAscaffold_79_\